MQGDQMVGGSGVTGIIIDEFLSSIIQGDQVDVESGITRSVIDDLHS